jgi:hypothetical protein
VPGRLASGHLGLGPDGPFGILYAWCSPLLLALPHAGSGPLFSPASHRRSSAGWPSSSCLYNNKEVVGRGTDEPRRKLHQLVWTAPKCVGVPDAELHRSFSLVRTDAAGRRLFTRQSSYRRRWPPVQWCPGPRTAAPRAVDLVRTTQGRRAVGLAPTAGGGRATELVRSVGDARAA